MSLTTIYDDPAHRRLATRMFRFAADAVNVELAHAEFGERNDDEPYSWLCYVVDPAADDRLAQISASSAADHFALMDPNGFLRAAGARIDATIFAAELSDEASINVRDDDGEPVLFSPWVGDLAVVRVKFNYRPAAQ